MTIRDTIDDLMTPGVGDPHHRAMTGLGHAMVSAAFVDTLGLYGLAPALVFALAYGWAKEGRDIRKGGSIMDSLEDTAFVAMGGLYGWAYWPLYCLATAFGVIVLAGLRR